MELVKLDLSSLINKTYLVAAWTMVVTIFCGLNLQKKEVRSKILHKNIHLLDFWSPSSFRRKRFLLLHLHLLLYYFSFSLSVRIRSMKQFKIGWNMIQVGKHLVVTWLRWINYTYMVTTFPHVAGKVMLSLKKRK